MRKSLILLPFALASLAACDQVGQKLGIEDAAKRDARMEAEGKAVGSACRQSGRAIEDCYSVYHWLPKAPIYTGWRDMDEYMRENKIETVTPQLPPAPPPETGKKKKKKTPVEGEADAKAADGDARADEEKAGKAESRH